jgi:hypothetical protein
VGDGDRDGRVEPRGDARGFGADPGKPVPIQELIDEPGFDPWVAVLPADRAVLAIEYGGWQGTEDPVLRRASARGRAASMHWDLSGKTLLSFARAGTVLDGFLPPPYHPPDDADVRAALDGLALEYNDPVETGLVAVERFTGYRLCREDVDRIEEEGVGYRILPWLPDLHPRRAAPGRLSPLDQPRPAGARHRGPGRPPRH